jgi:hypothetical protein
VIGDEDWMIVVSEKRGAVMMVKRNDRRHHFWLGSETTTRTCGQLKPPMIPDSSGTKNGHVHDGI